MRYTPLPAIELDTLPRPSNNVTNIEAADDLEFIDDMPLQP